MMKILEKKYRIICDSERNIKNDYKNEYKRSVTYCSNKNNMYFEADTLEEIEEIINKYKLKNQVKQ